MADVSLFNLHQAFLLLIIYILNINIWQYTLYLIDSTADFDTG